VGGDIATTKLGALQLLASFQSGEIPCGWGFIANQIGDDEPEVKARFGFQSGEIPCGWGSELQAEHQRLVKFPIR
jgi:hypothetical protein